MGNQAKEVSPAPQKPEKNDVKKSRTPENIQKENGDAQKKLIETVKKTPQKETAKKRQESKKPEKTPEKDKKEPVKKVKNWNVGIGTTTTESRDSAMKATTTGLKFQNKKKTAELTI